MPYFVAVVFAILLTLQPTTTHVVLASQQSNSDTDDVTTFRSSGDTFDPSGNGTLGCLISFVVFLVLHPNITAESSANQQNMVQMLFDSVDRSHPHSCKILLTDDTTKFFNVQSPSMKILRIVTLPRDVMQGPSTSFLSYLNGGCPIIRYLWYSKFLREHAVGHTLFLDNDILVVSDMSYPFKQIDFDLGITLTWQPSVALHANTKTINAGVIFVHANGRTRAAKFLEMVATTICQTVPPVRGMMDQLALHQGIILGQSSNSQTINLNGVHFQGEGTCIGVSFPPSLSTVRVVCFSKRFNSEATKVKPFSAVIHFTGRRKGMMKEWYDMFMHSGLRGVRKFVGNRRKEKDTPFVAKAAKLCREV